MRYRKFVERPRCFCLVQGSDVKQIIKHDHHELTFDPQNFPKTQFVTETRNSASWRMQQIKVYQGSNSM